MKYILELASLCLTSFFISLLLTKNLIFLLKQYGMIDFPDARRSHTTVTPRGGGLAFVIIFALLFPLFEYYSSKEINNSVEILQIFLPIAIVSFWDDIFHVQIPIRLIVHILCSVLAVMWLIHPTLILQSQLPIYLDLMIGAFALLAFLNIYNFLDGIDGLTASETIYLSITILTLCFLNYGIIPKAKIVIAICVITLGWAFGFLYFNWQPAKIFIGDVGSVSIGFLLGFCLLTVAATNTELFLACIIAPLYYIADGGLTILIRMLKGEKIWEPHLQHFFHKSVSKGRSHKQVVKGIMKCNFWLMIFSISSLYYPILSFIGAITVVMITLIRSVI